MSGDQIDPTDESREAQKLRDKFITLPADAFQAWASKGKNIESLQGSEEKARSDFNKKWGKMCGDMENPLELAQKAPATIKERDKSERSQPEESPDIEYLTQEEITLDDRVSTLDTMLVPDPEGPYYIERCIGRNQETRKLQVVRLQAREVRIEPGMVLAYLGHVVNDLNAVHTGNVVFGKRRYGYSFDRFYYLNGKRVVRCCLVIDRVHQAGLLYEKWVGRQTRKAFPRIRQQRDAVTGQPNGQPMYELVGGKEPDYRDLKRLFERHFLKRGDESLTEDVGLSNLLGAYE